MTAYDLKYRLQRSPPYANRTKFFSHTLESPYRLYSGSRKASRTFEGFRLRRVSFAKGVPQFGFVIHYGSPRSFRLMPLPLHTPSPAPPLPMTSIREK
jgi:hypothetical protein